MSTKKYTIEQGDTLGSIAKRFYGNALKYKEIAAANQIVNPHMIKAGAEIELPGLLAEGCQAHFEPVSYEQLRDAMPWPDPDGLGRFYPHLNDCLEEHEINTPLRQAHFLAQVAHESQSLHRNEENLNYGARALRIVFGRYFTTDDAAENYAHHPERIANIVYADRMGNGNTASGDGWKFRGRGYIQLTGRDNYLRCGEGLRVDLVANPDLVSDDPLIALASSCWFWASRGLNTYADRDDVREITRRINGGYNGLEHRRAFLMQAKLSLGV